MRDAACVLRVRSLYEEVARWVARPENREFMFVEPRRLLQGFAAGEDLSPGMVLTRMQFLGSWYAAENVAAFVESDVTSYDLLRTAHGYGLWETLLALALYRADGRRRRPPRLSRNELALRVARAAALDLLDECVLLGRVLVEESGTGFFYRDRSIVAPFILRLFCQWQRLDPPARDMDHEIQAQEYAALLAAWRAASDVEMAGLLQAACDLHLDRAREHTDDETFEFADQVYAVFPVEVLMVLQLRKQAALPIPAVDHPLMSMPLGQVVEAGRPLANDLLLRQITERIQARYTL